MMYPVSLLGSALLTASLARANPYARSGVTKSVLPFQVINSTSTAEVISVKGGLDLPKLTPGVNDTTFDWWYFDAVSTGKNESVTLVFYNFGQTTLAVPYLDGPLLVQVTGTYENGTAFSKAIAASGNANFESSDRGIASEWIGSGGSYSFTGSSLDMINPSYTISIDDPESGISGSLKLQSISPSRYPCDLNIPGVTQEIIPDIYWSNAVPDADAIAEFTIDGEPLQFQGYGYHDKNWGVKPLEETLNTWYWGHARVGSYSLVWLDALAKDGKEHFSSWITKDGDVVSKSCEEQSIVVRPWGENSEYPPTTNLSAPSGYNIRYELGDGKAFVANFTVEAVTMSIGIYQRLIGPIVGGIEGEEQYEGRSLCEQFQY
ncbi:hypothetical protein N8I77_002982 [Diaporthe amygdali]|uniref:Hydroxyneurosporene synthase n=1 Tax=Phomopsis amygdali TaxID=1214568 RepID=A0AAD9SJ10_PHOAM|nr:hypothetical protein N8I77_002982 [Diaporthe amygdali]